jgi:uncharacterized protein
MEGKSKMSSSVAQSEFAHRLLHVQAHRLGLSVDVYSPDLTGLLHALRIRGLNPSYLEIFRAAPTALAAVREQAGGTLLAYHGEGLWLTQPEAGTDAVFRHDVAEIAGHLQILQSAWLNHECATKHIAGYSFGTYLPPLYTEGSAEVVADHTRFVQRVLDDSCVLSNGCAPLVLLEMPPLTYFVAGTISVPSFFRLVIEQAPCGLVLDIGHLWTVYRYTGAWKRTSLMEFVNQFVSEFPLERVVEIHVAGLAVHESSSAGDVMQPRKRPDQVAWTDAHAAPIPTVLFDMLDRILEDPRLTSLKGLALEVDTKPVELILEEFEQFSRRYDGVRFASNANAPSFPFCPEVKRAATPVWDANKRELAREYERYARIATGRMRPEGIEWNADTACIEELDQYRSVYLPYEILLWGGEIEAMFPGSCRHLHNRGIPLARFVSFWFREPRRLNRTYDFFLLKIARFVEFIGEEAADLNDLTAYEAELLREAYRAANEPLAPTAGGPA